MKNFSNITKNKIIIAAILVVAIAVIAVITISSKVNSPKEDKGITAVLPAVTPATVENPDKSENPEANQEEKAEEQPIEYDISVIKSEDIETASAVSVKVDDDRNVTLKLEDGSSVEAGNIGGEEIKGTVTVVFVDYDNRIIKAQMVEKGTSATPPSGPVRTGYDFIGWSGNYTNPTKDTVVSAAYVRKDLYYTVTFRDYDGKDIRVEEVAAGGTAAGPAPEPAREGYMFAGWDSSLSDIKSDTVITATYVKSTDPLIEISSAAAQPGDKNVAVTISLKNNPGICSLLLDTEFSSGLTLSKFEFSKEIGGTSIGPQSVPASDTATFLWYVYDKDMTEDATVVTLYFDVSDDATGTQNVSVSYDADNVFRLDGENVTFGVMNGAVVIAQDDTEGK